MSEIQFFRPAVLWALFFLAAPIIVHFLFGKPAKRFALSSLRFLQSAVVSANRSRRLRRLLQLFFRLLIAAAAVALFARPYRARDPFSVLNSPQADLYVWIDPTLSMAYRQKGQTLYERGLALVDSAMQVRRGSGVYRYSATEREYVPSGALSRRVAPRHGPSGAAEAFVAFEQAAANNPAPSVLVMFSDFQAATASTLDTLLRERDSLAAPAALVVVQPERPWNYALGDARLSRESEQTVETTVRSEGRPLTSNDVVAYVNNMQVGRSDVQLESGESAGVFIRLPLRDKNMRGCVELSVDDPLPHDNRAFFSAADDARVRTLVVGRPESSFPFQAALGAADSVRWQSVASRSPERAALRDIEEADLIVFLGVMHPNPALAALLSSRAVRGKGVVFAPAPEHEAAAVNQAVFEHLGARRARIDSSETGLGLTLPDRVSSTWRGFPRLRDEDVRVYRYLTGLPGDPLLRFDNGRAAATEATDANGNQWIVTATPLGLSDVNNLAKTGMYVALIDRLARRALAGGSPESVPWIAGAPRPNPFFGARKRALVYRMDGALAAAWREQRVVTLDEPGLYRVQQEGEADRWLTVSANPDESRLSYVEPPAPERHLSHIRRLDEQSFPPFIRRAGANRIEAVLWGVLMLALLGEVCTWFRPRA